MKKQLIIFGIIVLLIFVGLSGCSQKEECWHYIGYSIYCKTFVEGENITFTHKIVESFVRQHPQIKHQKYIYGVNLEISNHWNNWALFIVEFEFVCCIDNPDYSITSAQTRTVRKEAWVDAYQTHIIYADAF